GGGGGAGGGSAGGAGGRAPRGIDRRALLAAERGTLHKQAETRIALVYPSPYRAAMSSLGYQQIYRVLHAMPGVAADRAMLPDPGPGSDAVRGGGFVALETARPVGGYPMLAYSVAYELEIAGVVDTLERAGIPVLAAERDARHPLIVAGGPLTFSNPAPPAPRFDVIVLGGAQGGGGSGAGGRGWGTRSPGGPATPCPTSTASACRRSPRSTTRGCRRAR